MQVVVFGPWVININYIESIRRPTRIDDDTWTIEVRVVPDNGSYYSQEYSSEFEAEQVYKKLITGFELLNK